MRKFLAIIIILLIGLSLTAEPVTSDFIRTKAEEFLQSKQSEYEISQIKPLLNEGNTAALLFELKPEGFILMSNRTELNPVIGYSFHNSFQAETFFGFDFKQFLIHELNTRKSTLTTEQKRLNQRRWQENYYYNRPDFEQWPPEGTTSTGGWLETNWTQSAPYNQFCPDDPATGTNSLTGCPATAMSMIINFHREINATRLNDDDDYEHYYNGSNHYFIDDDYEQHDFLSFPQINDYLETIETKYENGESLNTNEKAALNFACGVVQKQIFSSQVSGTYYYAQTVNGFHRFGFTEAKMLYESSPELYPRLQENMKAALPAQLCVINTSGAGHQIVVDGYNTDEEYHFNFGWGGSNNGWYTFPLSGIPYSLNIFGTIVLDINNDYEEYAAFDITAPENGITITQGESLMLSTEAVSAVESYLLFLDGQFYNSTVNLDNYLIDTEDVAIGNHELQILAYQTDYYTRYKSLYFTLEATDITWQEDFDSGYSGWSIESSNPLTWQNVNNDLINFTTLYPHNIASMTCPLSYENIDENLISPEIQLSDAAEQYLQFYVAFSDMYYQYPQLTCSLYDLQAEQWHTIWSGGSDNGDYGWDKIEFELSDYAGREIKLKFEAAGFSYADVSIDGLVIYSTAPTSAPEEVVKPVIAELQNYPNPFNPTTTITFSLIQPQTVDLTIYNLKGQLIKTLVSQPFTAGSHTISWDGRDDADKPAASGIYLYKLSSETETQTQKMLLLK